MVNNEIAVQLLDKSNQKTMLLMNQEMSFYPMEYKILYKWKKNGKHKYTVWISYTGAKSFGNEEVNEEKFEYNHKLRETAASAIRRASAEINNIDKEIQEAKETIDM